jgi:hypothetical protein
MAIVELNKNISLDLSIVVGLVTCSIIVSSIKISSFVHRLRRSLDGKTGRRRDKTGSDVVNSWLTMNEGCRRSEGHFEDERKKERRLTVLVD